MTDQQQQLVPCLICGKPVPRDFSASNPEVAYMDGFHHKACLDAWNGELGSVDTESNDSRPELHLRCYDRIAAAEQRAEIAENAWADCRVALERGSKESSDPCAGCQDRQICSAGIFIPLAKGLRPVCVHPCDELDTREWIEKVSRPLGFEDLKLEIRRRDIIIASQRKELARLNQQQHDAIDCHESCCVQEVPLHHESDPV